MSSRATFTEVRLGIMGGYIHAVTWQIVDTRQVALLLIFIVSHFFNCVLTLTAILSLRN